VKTLTGEPKTLREHEGEVLLIVNTASQCGFTPQYAGLEKLQKELGSKGFSVLGFPCNQFGRQEPGNPDEIQSFCDTTFGVSFPLHAKIDVNGSNAHPLFKHLKHEAPGVLGTEAIKWNFTKFLVDQQGRVLKRYAPSTTPDQIREDVEKVLAKKPTGG
jgi:glutathione peroxidase